MTNFSKNPLCTIVGAGEGLGKSLARKFAREGFDIALISRSESTAAPIIDTLHQSFSTVTARFFAADVTKPAELEAVISGLHREMGDTAVLLYNARGGFEVYEPLDLPYDVLDNLFRVEVVGALAAAKAVMPAMIKKGSGSVFYSSATAAYRGSSQYPHYAIAKFGLRALSQSLSKAYSKHGIHIAHMRLDCDLDVPLMQSIYADSDHAPVMVNPEDIAESYWLTHLQPRTAWSNEVELRPLTETWTY